MAVKKSNRVFTDEELKELGEPTVNLIKKAIDEGDKEKAKKLADRMLHELLHQHDLFMNWAACLMSYIYNNNGEEELYKAMKSFFDGGGLPAFGDDIRSRVEHFAEGMRGHGVPIKFEEDDEKISATMMPCGTGSKLIETGRYKPPFNYTMIQKPSWITWGTTDFPIYCCHAPIIERLSLEKTGMAMSVCANSPKVGRPGCSHVMYKNPADLPEKYYTRLGMKKPKAAKK